jgi:g-D-glutamyl-meso-diaminopimelate peptidase
MTKKVMILLFVLFQGTNIAKADEGIVRPQQVYSYQALEKDLKELKERYGPWLDITKIGTSHFGRKIYAIKLGKGEKNILLIGAHHGREWITTALLMEMIEQYAHSYDSKGKIGPYSTDVLDQVSIWFVPMLNPDGVEIQQGNISDFPFYFRRSIYHFNEKSYDFSRWKANGKGIDLNRQYPAGWEDLSSKPSAPSYQFYKGKKPLTAKEVKSITRFTKKISPLIAISYHSSGREIFWKYKNGINTKRDERIARKISYFTGYKLSEPPDTSFGGGYTDWFISTFHRPAATIEICPLVENTNPPISTFREEWERNKYVGIMLANEAKKMGESL